MKNNIQIKTTAVVRNYGDNNPCPETVTLETASEWLSRKLSDAKNIQEMVSAAFLRSLRSAGFQSGEHTVYEKPSNGVTFDWCVIGSGHASPHVYNLRLNKWWFLNRKPRATFTLAFESAHIHKNIDGLPSWQGKHGEVMTCEVTVL